MENKRLRKNFRNKLKNKSLKVEYSFIKILTGSDLFLRKLPFMKVKSSNHGPVIWLVGCIHGDELGGTVVIQEIFKRIRKSLKKGVVYGLPLLNPMGFETSSRDIVLSNEDLNRSFIGKENGSLAERIANMVFKKIKKTNPTLVLDLHNDWRKSIPYALVDKIDSKISKETYEKTKEFAKKSGLAVVLDNNFFDTTLTYSMLENNIPSLTLELGESEVVNEENVEIGVKVIMNILSDLGMVDKIDKPFEYAISEEIKGKILVYSSRPLSSTSGIIRFLIKPKDYVVVGQPIARIYNSFGKLLETLHATQNALVLGYSDYSVVLPGVAFMAFGVV